MSEIYFEDYSWYIKLVNKYNEVKYLEVIIDVEISYIDQIFELMSSKIPEGYIIADRQNLYTLNDLPCEYWNKDENPICFESLSESDWGFNTKKDLDISYFDTIIKSF